MKRADARWARVEEENESCRAVHGASETRTRHGLHTHVFSTDDRPSFSRPPPSRSIAQTKCSTHISHNSLYTLIYSARALAMGYFTSWGDRERTSHEQLSCQGSSSLSRRARATIYFCSLSAAVVGPPVFSFSPRA